MKRLSKELKEQIVCKVNIQYGRSIDRDKDGYKSIEKVKQVCNKYNLNIAIFDDPDYWCDNYRILSVTGEISLKEAEQLKKELGFLRVIIYYSNSQFTLCKMW